MQDPINFIFKKILNRSRECASIVNYSVFNSESSVWFANCHMLNISTRFISGCQDIKISLTPKYRLLHGEMFSCQIHNYLFVDKKTVIIQHLGNRKLPLRTYIT